MNTYQLKMPHAVYSGSGALEQISGILRENKVKKVAVFTDKGIEAAGLLQLPMEQLEQAGAQAIILSDLPPEPTYTQAQELVDKCRDTGPDLILAVGGGSVMDTAKLAGVLISGEYTVKDLLDDPSKSCKGCKTLMVPTTAGTGSEATPNAIVAVPEKELKVGIVNDAMIADYVILDPVMIKKLPRSIAAATGVDALAHAIECYTSKKANPFSDLYALQALELIFKNIETACNNSEAVQAKNAMLLASFYAGVAIGASGTTAVHALSYPLGGKYHIPHGVSNAILLAPVMRFNEPACRERLARAYDRCCSGHRALTEQEKSQAVISKLEEIVKNLGIPTTLKEFGIPAGDLEGLVKAGMDVKRLLDNNMRTMAPDDARAIYQQIL